MQIVWWCLLASLVVTYSNAAVDVEKTVAQVQNILQQNSQLPRLTREEIIDLLNDIRAEDAKSKSSTQLQENVTITRSKELDSDNEINSVSNLPVVDEDYVSNEKVKIYSAASMPTHSVEYSTKKNEPNLMVVLPYTPRDGSSLQELYTRPPRTEMVQVTESNLSDKQKHFKEYPKGSDFKTNDAKLVETLDNNAKNAQRYQKPIGLSTDLQEFLNMHGLKGQPGQPDHFLLPLEGFKPLPPVKPVDSSVELPENILLTYDLISPSSEVKSSNNEVLPSLPINNFLYEPLRPDLPFELEMSSSESKKTVLPLELPKSRKAKAAGKPKYEPIDYDSIKVIPLQKGVSPETEEAERAQLENELRKRQTNKTDDSLKISLSLSGSTSDSDNATSNSQSADTSSTDSSAATDASSKNSSTTEVPITNPPSAPKDSAVADSDSGASIADLEESFGGLAPSQPGDSQLPPQRKNGFYWMLDWNSFLEVGDGDTKVNIRFEPKLGDPQMFLPVNVP